MAVDQFPNRELHTWKASKTMLSTILSLIIIGLWAAILGWLATRYPAVFDAQEMRQLFFPEGRAYVKPEPVERAAYMGAIALTFPAVLAMVGIIEKYQKRKLGVTFITVISLLLCIAPFAFSFADPKFFQMIFTRWLPGIGDIWLLPLAFQVAVALLFSCISIAWLLRSDAQKYNYILNGLLIVITLLLLGPIRYDTVDHIYKDGTNFEAVVYSLTQVIAGKTLLADLPAQYGLYAELMAPFFRLFGVSTASLTATFAIFMCISGVSLASVCMITIKSALIRCLSILTLCLFLGSTWYVLHSVTAPTQYYQIWPIRIFFPSMVLLGFVLVLRQGIRFSHLVLLSALSAIGVIWNLDWGTPAFGALVAYFLVRSICAESRNRRLEFGRLGALIAVASLVWATFALYLWIKSNGQGRFFTPEKIPIHLLFNGFRHATPA